MVVRREIGMTADGIIAPSLFQDRSSMRDLHP